MAVFQNSNPPKVSWRRLNSHSLQCDRWHSVRSQYPPHKLSKTKSTVTDWLRTTQTPIWLPADTFIVYGTPVFDMTPALSYHRVSYSQISPPSPRSHFVQASQYALSRSVTHLLVSNSLLVHLPSHNILLISMSRPRPRPGVPTTG